MTRDFLKDLGLEDESINKIMKEYGKGVEGYKGKAESSEIALKAMNEQLAQRDKDLEGLRKASEGSKDMQKTIKDLQEANVKQAEEYSANILKISRTNAIKQALVGKVDDMDMVTNFIDINKVELDEKGNIKNDFKQVLDTIFSTPKAEPPVSVKGAIPHVPAQQQTLSGVDLKVSRASELALAKNSNISQDLLNTFKL